MRECLMLDLRERDGRYHFRFGSSDDSAEKLDAFKKAFHYRDRAWDSERKIWSVPATEESEAKLAEIFPNAKAAFADLHSQLRLF
jgi:hypothetical protein